MANVKLVNPYGSSVWPTATTHPSYRPKIKQPSYDRFDITDPAIDSHAATRLTRVKSAVPVTRTVQVHNAAELKAALANAKPGTEIHMADGVYKGHFSLNGKSGVTISGSKNAVIDGGDTSSGYSLHLENSSNNTLKGFTIRGGQKGIVLDNSNHNILNGLNVQHVGDEAIHFRNNSSYNQLVNSYIDDTGILNPGFGEGVYIGSASSNNPHDRSNYNYIVNNTFGSKIRAENIDIKEGTAGGVITRNHFNVIGTSGENYADSAVDVKEGASGYRIENNLTTGRKRNRKVKIDIETHGKSARQNSIRNNR